MEGRRCKGILECDPQCACGCRVGREPCPDFCFECNRCHIDHGCYNENDDNPSPPVDLVFTQEEIEKAMALYAVVEPLVRGS